MVYTLWCNTFKPSLILFKLPNLFTHFDWDYVTWWVYTKGQTGILCFTALRRQINRFDFTSCSFSWTPRYVARICNNHPLCRFGCILGIDEYVMGLVVVAAGTSVPVSVGFGILKVHFMVFDCFWSYQVGLSHQLKVDPWDITSPGRSKLSDSGKGGSWWHGSVKCSRLKCLWY